MDSKQLNPVGEEESPVFFQDWENFELTEIIRQAEGNPIIQLSRNISWVKQETDNLIEDRGYCYSSDLDKIILKIMSNPKETRYLAWTNAEVNRINTIVRKRLYGNPAKIENGELLILAQPYEEYYTNYELEVKSLEIKTKFFHITKSDKIELTYYLINKEILAIHEMSERDFLNKRNEIKQLCIQNLVSWKVWFEFSELFIRYNYLYAITVHKS